MLAINGLSKKFSQEVRTKVGEPVTPEQPRMRSYCLIKLFNLIRLVPAKKMSMNILMEQVIAYKLCLKRSPAQPAASRP
jgi:hypothetical protein